MTDGHCEVDFSDYGDDCDPVEFYDWKMVRARKPHVCTECGGPIVVGEEYKRVSYRFEGTFSTDRLCPPCHEAAGEFGHQLVGAMLWEFFANEWEAGAHLQACLNRLTTARAKEHMRQQWLKHQDAVVQRRQRAIERRQVLSAGDPL